MCTEHMETAINAIARKMTEETLKAQDSTIPYHKAKRNYASKVLGEVVKELEEKFGISRIHRVR